MKKIILSLFFVITYLPFYSQITDCFNATPICDDNLTITNTIGNSSGYGLINCLGSTPNPKWFIFKVDNSGDFNFILSQGNNAPNYNNLDIDYVLWGPFEHLPDCTTDLYGFPSGNTSINNNLISCSYSATAVEFFNLTAANSGKFYVVLSTNFSNITGNIWLQQTNTGTTGAGTLVCDYVIINLQPQNEGFAANDNANFTVSSLNGDTYKWEMSTNGVDWSILNDGGTMPEIIGSDTNSLSLNNIPSSYSEYYFRVLVSNLNDNIYSKEVQLIQTLGVNNFDNSFAQTYYDGNNLVIKINQLQGSVDYQLIDMNGRSLKKSNFNSETFSIDLNEFLNGIYFLELKSDNGGLIKKILIKN